MFTPADGGPARPILVPIQFVSQQLGGPIKVPPPAMRWFEFQIGAFGAYTRPDYGPKGNVDVGGYASLSTKYIGIQADAVDTVDSRSGIREASVVAGPRFQYRYKPLTVYAKAQAGVGRFNVSPTDRSNNKTVAAVEQYGGGVELNAGHNLRFRLVDYSYQVWPEFSPHNLSPSIISAGVAVHF